MVPLNLTEDNCIQFCLSSWIPNKVKSLCLFGDQNLQSCKPSSSDWPIFFCWTNNFFGFSVHDFWGVRCLIQKQNKTRKQLTIEWVKASECWLILFLVESQMPLANHVGAENTGISVKFQLNVCLEGVVLTQGLWASHFLSDFLLLDFFFTFGDVKLLEVFLVGHSLTQLKAD